MQIQYIFNIATKSHIYTLFYTGADPNEYINTVKYFEENGTFDNIKEFGKYKFYLPEQITQEENIVYVIVRENNSEIDYSKWKATYFAKYIVLENKK